MSAPTSTMLIIAPDSTKSRLVGNQAPPAISGVRVIVITVGQFPERLRGVIVDTVIVMDGARPTGDRLFWQMARTAHRGDGPWLEMDTDFVGVKP